MPQQNKACAICGNEFKPYSEKSKFCSSACMGLSYRSKGSVRAGVKIGFLTMLEPCGKEGTICKKWLCRCDCGNLIQKSRTQLANRPDLADCGCKTEWPNIRRRYDKKKKDRSEFDRQVALFAQKSKKRGIEFSLTKEQVESLFLGDCYYCSAPPSTTKDKRLDRVVVRNGIDRINNDIGYVLENCVSCCYPCNWSKMDETMEDFLKRCKRIVSIHSTSGSSNVS